MNWVDLCNVGKRRFALPVLPPAIVISKEEVIPGSDVMERFVLSLRNRADEHEAKALEYASKRDISEVFGNMLARESEMSVADRNLAANIASGTTHIDPAEAERTMRWFSNQRDSI